MGLNSLFCVGCVPRAGVAAETPAGPAQARLPGQVPRQDRRAARGKCWVYSLNLGFVNKGSSMRMIPLLN